MKMRDEVNESDAERRTLFPSIEDWDEDLQRRERRRVAVKVKNPEAVYPEIMRNLNI